MQSREALESSPQSQTSHRRRVYEKIKQEEDTFARPLELEGHWRRGTQLLREAEKREKDGAEQDGVVQSRLLNDKRDTWRVDA